MHLPLYLIIPLAAGGITQCCKFLWESVRLRRIQWRALFSYGGMPSAHTALTVSLVTVVGLGEGVASPFFAIATIFAVIVVHDAIRLRRYLGSHGQALNMIVQELTDVERFRFIRFRERLGHTPLEAAVGGILGAVLTLLLYRLL